MRQVVVTRALKNVIIENVGAIAISRPSYMVVGSFPKIISFSGFGNLVAESAHLVVQRVLTVAGYFAFHNPFCSICCNERFAWL